MCTCLNLLLSQTCCIDKMSKLRKAEQLNNLIFWEPLNALHFKQRRVWCEVSMEEERTSSRLKISDKGTMHVIPLIWGIPFKSRNLVSSQALASLNIDLYYWDTPSRIFGFLLITLMSDILFETGLCFLYIFSNKYMLNVFLRIYFQWQQWIQIYRNANEK